MHVKLEKQILGIFGLTEKQSFGRPCDLKAKEVVKGAQVLELKGLI